MAKYTSVTVSGYNTSPPADDGTVSTANKVRWETIKTKLSDPLNSFASAVNSQMSTAILNTFLASTSEKSGSFSVDVTEDGMSYSCTDTGTASLPAVDDVYAGFAVLISNDGSGVITVDADSTELVGGAETQDLDENEWAIIQCNGTAWLFFKAVTEAPPAPDISAAYPVGSVYMNVSDGTNPATLLGFGTWAALAEGRVLIGAGEGDTLTARTAGDTGGAETHTLSTTEMPAHTHSYPSITNGAYGSGAKNVPYPSPGDNSTTTSSSTGGGGAHNNMQPFLVVYMWKRTA